MLRGLDAAPIGTFHEFCARLLRRHAMQAGVDPEFAILDESIAGSLREEAVRIALRKLLAARDADLIDLGTDYGLRQVREALGRLASIARRGRPGGVGEAGARGDRRALAGDGRRHGSGRRSSTAHGPLAAHCRRLLERARLGRAEDPRPPRGPARRPAPPRPRRTPLPRRRLDELVGLLRVADLPRAASWPSEEIYEAVKDAFAELREHIKKHVSPALGWDDADALLATAGRGLRFARLALAVRREHERLKRRRRGLDFDDLLVMARDLLRDHPELGRA